MEREKENIPQAINQVRKIRERPAAGKRGGEKETEKHREAQEMEQNRTSTGTNAKQLEHSFDNGILAWLVRLGS